MLARANLNFFYMKLFINLHDGTKLKLIRYNKYLQDILNINIMDYKRYSGKYIIFEAKGKGKEYDGITNNLLFEGEYLNGKRNGKGKEYKFNLFFLENDLLFDGEYLNGKRNGKGKEYYSNGNLKFIGEYLNGKKYSGKEYDFEGNFLFELKEGKGFIKEYDFHSIIFEGDYPNGKGKDYHRFGFLEYEGEFMNGERHGKGKEYHGEKLIFEGEYKNGKKWNGKVYDKKNKNIYEVKEGKGFIKEYFDDGRIKSEVEYFNGEKNGKGKEYNEERKLKFEGEYLNGKRNGKGKEYDENGKLMFEGEYLYNNKLKGKYYVNGLLEFEGEFLYNKKWDGKGYDENGNIIYELKQGNGKVKEYDDFGRLIFEGEYLNGERNGKAKIYNAYFQGKLVFEGEYLNGKKNGKAKEYGRGTDKLKFEGEYLNDEKNGVRNIIIMVKLNLMANI